MERLESCCFVALGCSGHGKTFAVTGGPRRFEDRGLVPRAISCLFELLNAKTNREDFQVKVSFFAAGRQKETHLSFHPFLVCSSLEPCFLSLLC